MSLVTSLPDSGISANRDLYVSPDYASRFPHLATILTDNRFLSTFDKYDQAARTAKSRYNRLGVLSVVLAVAALEGEIASLCAVGLGGSLPRWINLAAGAFGLLAVVIIIASRITHLRYRWLEAVFVRERLRQWRHQILLDGELMDLMAANDPKAHDILDRRWQQFLQDASVAEGGFYGFIGTDGAHRNLMFPHATPSDPAIRQEVLELQRQLRIDYQLGFSEAKTATGGRGQSVAEVTYITDWLATTTLVIAVVLTAASFIVSILQSQTSKGSIILAAVAAGLAILSAGTRAARSGLTIPDERDSYSEYSIRMHALAEVFRTASTTDDRWGALVRAEVAAADELRRFLRAKWHSRFLV